MSKINYKRLKEKRWKGRIPVPPPTRIITPDVIYDRVKQRKGWRKKLSELEGKSIKEIE